LTRPPDEYWDLLAQTARLQARLGEDLVAWAKIYSEGGKALRRSAGTLEEMALLGQRMQSYMESGPPLAVTQIMRMFAEPWAGLRPGMSMPGVSGPFAQLLEDWTSGLHPHEPPREKEDTS